VTARDAVLGAVRSALGRGPGAPPPAPADIARTYRTTTDVVPGSPAALELLVDRLVDYRATVVRCTAADLAATLADQLADAGSVAVPPGLPGQWLDAVRGTGATVVVDTAADPLTPRGLDGLGAVLTACRVAMADTGTIVLDGAPDQGRRVLTLVPDRHVCVVRADQVVGSVPEAVALLAEHPERPQTWISGPSATSDIELVRVEGVHGPRDLRVVVVEHDGAEQTPPARETSS
jgi:L-lactate dehydrogenase complex protein LldG